MTYPNRNTLWASVLVDELVESGIDAVCVSPGSRSTPLTVACYEHEDLQVFSHLDERSAGYFALGRALRTGTPTPLICTSGTAAANFHPAVIEADRARVPLLLLTADRPPELRDSGANQTVDQVDLYGDAVRWFRDLPEPEPADRKLRRLRVDAARAVSTATGEQPGPVHLNVPFRKPLEPTPVDEPLARADAAPDADRDADADSRNASGEALDEQATDDAPAEQDADGLSAAGLGGDGRDGPFVQTHAGVRAPAEATIDELAGAIEASDRVLLVAGPNVPGSDPSSELAALAQSAAAPLLADPLSGARFGSHVDDSALVCGGYDAYLGTAAADAWPEPEFVLRVGASPTSKPLRKYLAGTDARQVLVDPAGQWREAEFTATDLVTAGAGATSSALADALEARSVDPDSDGREAYRRLFADAEAEHWSLVDALRADSETAVGSRERSEPGADDRPRAEQLEGTVVPAVLDALPDRATLFASNSMPVRDLDRFARPDSRTIAAHANRGASGVDGVTSTALGAASAGDDPLVAIVGDVAYYHDMNGLLAAERCDVDATIVLVNNDGGGIFHALPIESFDPPFTEGFKTPHGLDFEPTGSLYDLSYRQVDLAGLTAACADAVGSSGVDVLELQFDSESSHRTREALVATLDERLRSR